MAVILFATGCRSELFTDLDEREANRIIVALNRGSINARKEKVDSDSGTRWRIIVKNKNFQKALEITEKNNLPSIKANGVMEIFGKSGFLPTHTAEKALEAYSLNAELARTIEEIQGVVKARVHVVMRKNGVFEKELAPSTASVLINYISEGDGELAFGIDDIKKIVSGGVEGLTEDNVKVVVVPVKQEVSVISERRQKTSILLLAMAPLFLFSGALNILLWIKFGGGKIEEYKDGAVSEKEKDIGTSSSSGQ
ncbi:MAG TPA: hypothetical protein VII00_02965 [bacterium]